MATWTEFAADEPRLADMIRALLQQYGPGLGYLATVRADGGPRVHPVSPVFTEEGLFCLILDSPKRRDLEHDGRYALHSFPPEDSDDEAYLAGRAYPIHDQGLIDRIARVVRASPGVDWRLFEFSVDVAMFVRHGVRGLRPADERWVERPGVQIWLDPRSRADTVSLADPGIDPAADHLPVVAMPAHASRAAPVAQGRFGQVNASGGRRVRRSARHTAALRAGAAATQR